ncbi:MAG TPA: glutamine synthetase family protein [Burkholderiales bacterium]|jgi:glutamine synthetase|nr:glutamine synthetase family protein [Burkholderiales bacterium]
MAALSRASTRRIVEEVRSSPATRVKVAVSDTDGVLRGKYLHKEKFLSAVESGFGFCNVVFGWDSNDQTYDNTIWTGWHTGFPDALVQLDFASFRRVPWDDNVPFFLGEFVEADGSPLPVCPRQLYKRVLARAAKMGFQVLASLEYEWFNFRETSKSLAEKGYIRPEPISPGMFGYSLIRAAQSQPFLRAIMEELPAFGVPVEGLHTETGPGVFEAAILYTGGIDAGDRGILFKQAAKEIGLRFGIMPSFMAKWSTRYPGCSGHIHQSLSDGKRNLFYDARHPHRMSKLFESYLAGQLALLEDLQAMYAPTVNSYKRLVDGMWAPVKRTWGVDNRTATLRVIPGSAKSTRLESRCPGADVNPYIALAAVVGAGLWGIEKKLKLKDAPLTGDAAKAAKIPRLPRNLMHATENLKRSKAARELFGETFVDHFVRTREWEWRQFQDAVTDWELKRYFEII